MGKLGGRGTQWRPLVWHSSGCCWGTIWAGLGLSLRTPRMLRFCARTVRTGKAEWPSFHLQSLSCVRAIRNAFSSAFLLRIIPLGTLMAVLVLYCPDLYGLATLSFSVQSWAHGWGDQFIMKLPHEAGWSCLGEHLCCFLGVPRLLTLDLAWIVIWTSFWHRGPLNRRLCPGFFIVLWGQKNIWPTTCCGDPLTPHQPAPLPWPTCSHLLMDVCVPFYLAGMVATRLFRDRRKEHP